MCFPFLIAEYGGQPDSKGAAENTLAALKEAHNRNFNAIEIDVALTGPYPESSDAAAFLGHYFSLRSVGEDSEDSPARLRPFQVPTYNMNLRNQTPSSGDDNKLTMFTDALDYAKQNDLLLLVDPKAPRDAQENNIPILIAYVLNHAYDQGSLANIAIKTTYKKDELITKLTPYLTHPYSEFDGKFLWSPISSIFPNDSELDDVISYIKDWHLSTNESKQVITYEVNTFSPSNPAGQAFTRDGVTYQNIIDYVRQLTPSGKRSALWSIDPMGNKGTLDRLYNWKFLGNTSEDLRGDVMTTFSYDYSEYIAINTDRPDLISNLF